MSSPRLTVLSGCQVQALLVENSTEDEDGLSVGSSSGGDLDPDLVEQDQLRVCGVDFLEGILMSKCVFLSSHALLRMLSTCGQSFCFLE